MPVLPKDGTGTYFLGTVVVDHRLALEVNSNFVIKI
jgi:hypothetical protein